MIPARPYPGDEEAVRLAGVPLGYCTCPARADDDAHRNYCKFWKGVLKARKQWHDRNIVAWSCSEEAHGHKRCKLWCGHITYCTATGTDRRAHTQEGQPK